MSQINDNYPTKKVVDLTDEEVKLLALQNYKQQEVKKTNFPTEIISLPSKGLLYPEGHPLASGTIEMKYMTAREEDILTSQNLIKQGVVIDKLMQSMIISPINYNDIIVGDKNAMMVACRILGYGKDYDVTVNCPSCDTDTKLTIDLTKLEPKNVTVDNNISTMIAPNQFEVTLPSTKRKIVFQLLTHGAEKLIEKELAVNKKSYNKDSVDNELTTRLKHLIISVDNNTEQSYINNFVDVELFAMDSRVLRGQIKDVAPDQPFLFNFECPHCGHQEDGHDFPISTQFFWPGT